MLLARSSTADFASPLLGQHSFHIVQRQQQATMQYSCKMTSSFYYLNAQTVNEKWEMDCNLEDEFVVSTELQFKHSQPASSARCWSLVDDRRAVVMATRATKCAYLSQWHDQPSGAALASYCSSCSLASCNLRRKWSVLKPPHFQSWIRVCKRANSQVSMYKEFFISSHYLWGSLGQCSLRVQKNTNIHHLSFNTHSSLLHSSCRMTVLS